ncbi:FmdB family zinc ribbon protein [Microvirga lotononidis]|uniref:FmdB family zinc ribbon protein n=1 Tax=Microvirga lotononidis TaxID=864069 RepID=UPI000A052588|nr:zinc ribbon domain-containing protein [Microvirga lotononidis]WQO27370.1 zinc ribbon domain-containing protein [Microvirga lotononidis]
MPIYDYQCQGCGPFTAMQPMARFQDPCACPKCGAEASRAVLSAPAIASMDPTRRSTLASNERNASGQRPTKAAHPAGCGCCVRRLPLPGALSADGRIFTSHGPVRCSWQ